MTTSEAPDYMEPLTGFRIWRPQGLPFAFLKSMYISGSYKEWPFREPKVKQCACTGKFLSIGGSSKVVVGQARGGNCCLNTCGIYAFKTMGRVIAEIITMLYAMNQIDDLTLKRIKDSHLQIIFGTVSMWGKVIEHDKGYRAELAYPKELFIIREFLPEERPSLDLGLEKGYGVPVHRLSFCELIYTYWDDMINETEEVWWGLPKWKLPSLLPPSLDGVYILSILHQIIDRLFPESMNEFVAMFNGLTSRSEVRRGTYLGDFSRDQRKGL